MQNQEKGTGICGANVLTALKTAARHVFGNWVSPSQVCSANLFCISLMFLPGLILEAPGMREIWRRKQPTVLILQFVSKALV